MLPPPSAWTTRPIFISSTFLDMHAERDHLRQQVFPELEERLRQRRQFLEPIDLRLGVDTVSIANEVGKELLVLKVCLDEIQRSRPYLIALLGDRYGWVPPEERMRAATLEVGFECSVAGKSVTALEIEFGVLSDLANQSGLLRVFIYLREPLPYHAMPAAVRAQFSDEHSTDPNVRDRHADLLALKQRLIEHPGLGPRVRHYQANWNQATQQVDGLEAWGRQVLEDIWNDLKTDNQDFAARATASWEDQERESLQEFVEQRARGFVGRGHAIKKILELARTPNKSPAVCITGERGAGKSAFFAQIFRHLQNDNSIITLAHAAGITPRAIQVDSMLARWIQELSDRLERPSPLTTNPITRELDEAFGELLTAAAKQCRVVVLIDALDQFEASPRAARLGWLPSAWPANARLIMTAIEKPQIEGRLAIATANLPPLRTDEGHELAAAVGQRYHRAFHPDVMNVVLAKRLPDGKQAAGNPLWLTMAIEELNLLDADDFARAKLEFHGSAEQQLHQLVITVADELPADVEGLYRWMLQKTEKVFGAAPARALADMIGISRFGWREQDLRVLMPQATQILFPNAPIAALDDLAFAALRRGFRTNLIRRGKAEQLDFFHKQMRVAIHQRNLSEAVLVQKLHRCAADYLQELPFDDPIRQTELMHHLLRIGDSLRPAQFFSGLSDASPAIGAATGSIVAHVLDDAGQEDNRIEEIARWLGLPQLSSDERIQLAGHFSTRLSAAFLGQVSNRQRLILLNAAGGVLERALLGGFNRYQCEKLLTQWLQEMSTLEKAEGRFDKAHEYLTRSVEMAERAAADVTNPSALRGDPAGAEKRRAAQQVIIDQGTHAEQGHALFQMAQALIAEAQAAQVDASVPAEERARLKAFEAMALQSQLPGENLRLAGQLRMQGYSALQQGRITEASEAFQRSLLLAQSEAMRFESQWSALNHVFNAFIGLGDVELSENRIDAARRHFELALETADRLTSIQGASGPHLQAFGWARIADIHRKTGHPKDAEVAFEKSETLFRTLAREKTGNVEARIELASAIANFGNFLESEKQFSRAREKFGESLHIFKQLLADQPHDMTCRQNLNKSLTGLGYFELGQNNLEQARLHLHERWAIAKRWFDHEPHDARSQFDLAIASAQLGDPEAALGNLNAARELYLESRTLLLGIASVLPAETLKINLEGIDTRLKQINQSPPDDDDREKRWSDARCWLEAGEKLLDTRDIALAREHLDRALSLMLPLAHSWPDNLALQADLAVVYRTYMVVNVAEKQYPRAIDSAHAEGKILEQLASRLPDDDGDRLRRNYRYHARLLLMTGQIAEARRVACKELASIEALAQRSPADSRLNQEYSESLYEQARLSMFQNDWNTAVDWLGRCVAIRDRLAWLQPGDVAVQAEWLAAFGQLSCILECSVPIEATEFIRDALRGCLQDALFCDERILDLRGRLQDAFLAATDHFWRNEFEFARPYFLFIASYLELTHSVLPGAADVLEDWSAVLGRLAVISVLEDQFEHAGRFLLLWSNSCKQSAGLIEASPLAANLDAAVQFIHEVLRNASRSQRHELIQLQLSIAEQLYQAMPHSARAASAVEFCQQVLRALTPAT